MINLYVKLVVIEVILCLLIGVGCDNKHNNSTVRGNNKRNVVPVMNPEFEIALNPVQPYNHRIISALKLNVQDRLTLQEMLLSRLPGNYSTETMDDLSVLAEIGDENAAKDIEKIIALDKQNGVLVPGQINSIRNYALKKIKERQ